MSPTRTRSPESGEVHYRRLESQQWIELPTKFQPGERADEAALGRPLPESLGPGIYLFRADAVDARRQHRLLQPPR